jgi:DNA helicase IV
MISGPGIRSVFTWSISGDHVVVTKLFLTVRSLIGRHMLLTSTPEVESAIMLAVKSDSAGVLRLLFSRQVEFGFRPSKVEQLIEIALNADSIKATKVLKDLADLERALQNDWMGFGRLMGEHRFSYLPPVYFSSIRSNFIMNWFAERSNLPPDSDQAAAIGADAKNVLVTARAGSGKTKTLIDRATFLQQHCSVRPDQILILAFNKKAVDEVSERLSEDPSGQPFVRTFHALAHSLVENPGKIISDSAGDAQQKWFIQQNVIDPILNDEPDHEFRSVKQLMVQFFRDDWEESIQIENLAPFDRDELLRLRNSVPHVGLDSDRYKSKGEKWIADYLFEHDFWYEYEQSIPWDGWDGSYRPDFQIRGLKDHVKTKKPIIIEFFGLTGNKEYDRQK